MNVSRTPGSDDLAPSLRALADPTRLKILLMLEGKERTVGEIVQFFALSQPTISRHLQTLQAAGLVQRRKVGSRVYYGTHAGNLGGVCVALADSFPCCGVAVVRPDRRPTPESGRRNSTSAKRSSSSRKSRRSPDPK